MTTKRRSRSGTDNPAQRPAVGVPPLEQRRFEMHAAEVYRLANTLRTASPSKITYLVSAFCGS